MRITDKVKIGGQVFEVNQVQCVSDDDKNVDGKIWYDKGLIQIQVDVKDDYKEYVLLHEIMHGIFEFCGYEQDENRVDVLARALHMVIKDNPEVFKTK